jgi:Xaa-Pro aminopeptidase
VRVLPLAAFKRRIAEEARRRRTKDVAVDSERTTVAALEDLRRRFPRLAFLPAPSVTAALRARKDHGEIESIRRALALTEQAFVYALALTRPGTTEIELQVELDHFLKKHSGGEEAAFRTIVLSGPRTSLPHGKPSARRLRPGDFVLFDFGARPDGYCADFTRTVVLGEPTPRQVRVYETVRRANEKARRFARAGITAGRLDSFGRGVIRAAGFGKRFGHGLGHGLGIEIHEKPYAKPGDKTMLEPGMVLTVEPGVYIPGWGGVRIEDVIVIGPHRSETLTRFPRELVRLRN